MRLLQNSHGQWVKRQTCLSRMRKKWLLSFAYGDCIIFLDSKKIDFQIKNENLKPNNQFKLKWGYYLGGMDV